MRLNTLRSKMVVFLVALLGVIQIGVFTLVNSATTRAARIKIDDELVVGEKVFASELKQNADRLAQAASVLASDFAFREAIATGDSATMESALENHGARVKAAVVLFVDLQGMVLDDTIRGTVEPRRFELQSLIDRAKSAGQATSIAMIDERVLQLVAVPVQAPITIGWIVIGFPVDQILATDLRNLTGLQVSFVTEQDGRWNLLASTLSPELSQSLLEVLPPYAQARNTRILAMPEQHQLRVVPLGESGSNHFVAVLQRPINDAMGSFRDLSTQLIALGLFSLLLSIAGSVVIAVGITRPLDALLQAVRRIRRGDYAEPIAIHRGDEIGILAQGLDHMRAGIAEREQKILKLAYEDSLTRLPNRSQFGEQLQREILSAAEQHRTLAIFVMDLDRFKYVNDHLGHSVGDHVLTEVAVRLRNLLREGDCVARLGGDEFAVLVPTADDERVTNLASSIIAALEQPIDFEGQPLDVGASIGIALYPVHGGDAQTLMRNADIAMYVAKRTRSGFTVYDPYYDTSQQEHLSLLGELRRAVEQNELRLYYQPKVTLNSAGIHAAEALIRWIHPVRGMVPPGLFIPFAEHTGYIKILTRWVLTEAIRQCGAWLRQNVQVEISVNLSARDLSARELPELISGLLAEHQVPPHMICLEITESGFMEDPAHAQRVLDRLSAIGLRLSIDDYGTGYSSLSYIMKLPVNELKIDRAFVSNMSEDPDMMTIVRSTIELGHNLGLKVVAEGIEDSKGYALLRGLGCDYAQGYYISPPMSAEALPAWLNGSVTIRRLPESMMSAVPAESEESGVSAVG
ncbi:MAG TPA: EAL domain-containing protein [Steroidobacteraceae bacterium]|jgi:diguanylate cyclase (GGDEF)-like protein|nr:EAL domain-containing protein [Steroidobacteraceae bacterium]